MKKVLFFIIFIIAFVIIKNLTFSIFNLWQKQDVLAVYQSQLEAEKEKNRRLKSELSIVKSPEFIEEQARNKLFMVKEGENELVMPPVYASKTPDIGEDDFRPNIRKWIDLFY